MWDKILFTNSFMSVRSITVLLVVAAAAMVLQQYISGKAANKDGTAMGVAKIRHYEALHEPSTRLYHDPYASYMYPGSFVQTWLGEGGTLWLFSKFMKGAVELLTTRTKWMDDEVMKALKEGAEQFVILGAGYDTRGFRLDIPTTNNNGFCCVVEVDQPEVQAKKIKKLETIAKTDEAVADRMKNLVKFVSVDFRSESIGAKLIESESYNSNKKTVVTFEGVTQYIPKESTADTLTQLHKILAPQSTLVVSYVPQDVFDDPSKCGSPKNVQTLVSSAEKTGEPWISGWTPEGFRQFLSDLGYEVVSDVTAKELNDQYLEPLGRGLEDNEVLGAERYVVATTVPKEVASS